jgi:hypothetical protein
MVPDEADAASLPMDGLGQPSIQLDANAQHQSKGRGGSVSEGRGHLRMDSMRPKRPLPAWRAAHASTRSDAVPGSLVD